MPSTPGRRGGQRIVARGLALLALAAMLVLGPSGCLEDPDAITVRLRTGPVLVPSPVPAAKAQPLRFVLASVLSPERSAATQERFAGYLAAHLEQPVTVVRRKTYMELNELLRRGTAQMGLVCAGAYAAGRAQFGLRLVLVPVVNGRITDRSCVIVRRESGRKTLEDLKGAVFAFTDPLSNSGYRCVASRLAARGTTPDRFFERTLFTYSHDSTIQAVKDGIADGGAVDGLIWESIVRETPLTTHEVEVIERSDEFPTNPIVVSPRAPRGLARRLQATLLGMPDDPVGRNMLKDLGCSGFVTLPESAYDAIEAAWIKLGVVGSGKGL